MTLIITRPLNSGASELSALFMKEVIITGDANYPLGGYAISATVWGFTQRVYDVFLGAKELGQQPYNIKLDRSWNTLRFFATATTPSSAWAEVATGTNLAAFQCYAVAIGT